MAYFWQTMLSSWLPKSPILTQQGGIVSPGPQNRYVANNRYEPHIFPTPPSFSLVAKKLTNCLDDFLVCPRLRVLSQR